MSFPRHPERDLLVGLRDQTTGEVVLQLIFPAPPDNATLRQTAEWQDALNRWAERVIGMTPSS